MVSENFLENLKQKVDILAVASSYVKLSRRGRNWVGLCPFHAEKTASFNIYPESNSFYCFGCGEGGDVISFIEKIENLDYLESLKMLADMAGIVLNLDDSFIEKEKKEVDAKRKLLKINRETAKFFYKALWYNSSESESARNHLKKRNFSKGTLVAFGLGYAPEDKYVLVDYLIKKGYTQDEIVAANLAYNKYGRLCSRFYKRLIFPIIGPRGNVLAFGGRTLSPDVKPKYLNTSDTAVFKKSMNLFSLNFAKKEKMETLILVEGYMDVVALYQNGFKNTVATLGTSLTQYQTKLIGTLVKEVVICYDSDQAGEHATERAAGMLRREGLKVKIVHVPNGKDPEEFLRISGENASIKFKKILNESKNDVEYSLMKEYKKVDIKTSEGKVAYLGRAVKVLSMLNDRLEQEVYASKISRITGVSKSTILDQVIRQMKRVKRKCKMNQVREVSQNLKKERQFLLKEGETESIKAVKAEEAIIAHIINNPESANNIFLRLPTESFCSKINKEIYKVIYEKFRVCRNISFQNLSAGLSQENRTRVAKYLACESLRDSSAEDVDNYVKTILHENDRSKISDLSKVSDDEIVSYINKLRQLKR